MFLRPMVQIFCSQKLAKLFGLPSKKTHGSNDINPGDISETWNGHLYAVDKRKCLIFTNKKTLYSFVLFDVLKKDLADFNTLFTDGFIKQLKFDQLMDDHQEIEIRKLYDKIVLSNTDNDKKVIGSMNDYVYNLKFMVADEGGIKNANPNMIGNLLNSTPMKAIKYGYPVDRMRNEIKTKSNITTSYDPQNGHKKNEDNNNFVKIIEELTK